jgi:glucokinase
MYYLGIDIGGTAVKAGLVDELGRVQNLKQIPTVGNDLDRFLLTLTELIADFQKSFTLEAVGIGVAGLRSLRTNSIVVSPNIPCLINVDLERILTKRLHVPVTTDNDAKAGVYAEFVAGAGNGRRHMAYVTLGTGLGAGIIVDGKILQGASGYAGELGHTVIEPDGRLCACGKRGCLETIVSATGIVATARERMKMEPASAVKVFDAAMQGDEGAKDVFRYTGRYLGLACANLMNLFNLEVIIIGGGVLAAGEVLLGPTREEAERQAFPAAFADCQIVQSHLWPDAGMIGAAMLARDRK